MVRMLILLAAVGLLLAACSDGPVVGKIVDKQHEERQDNSYWWWNSCAYTRTGPNNTTQCQGALQYMWNIDDEDWVLQVQTYKEDGLEGKIRRKEVSKEDWYAADVGDWYDSEEEK